MTTRCNREYCVQSLRYYESTKTVYLELGYCLPPDPTRVSFDSRRRNPRYPKPKVYNDELSRTPGKPANAP
jgi:hypothetical protein